MESSRALAAQRRALITCCLHSAPLARTRKQAIIFMASLVPASFAVSANKARDPLTIVPGPTP